MKFMAIGRITAPMEKVAPHMSKEPAATLKLYVEGKIEQFWFVENKGPIFLMNVESEADAKAQLATLPLVAADVCAYDLLLVGPLVPLGRLIQS